MEYEALEIFLVKEGEKGDRNPQAEKVFAWPLSRPSRAWGLCLEHGKSSVQWSMFLKIRPSNSILSEADHFGSTPCFVDGPQANSGEYKVLFLITNVQNVPNPVVTVAQNKECVCQNQIKILVLSKNTNTFWKSHILFDTFEEALHLFTGVNSC